MKDIYVILSATPTKMGKMIRILTRYELNHTSISLTENLTEMYSFARYRAANPLVGGFVKEFPQRLSLGKNRDIYIKIYKIPINNTKYNNIKAFIDNMKNDKEENIYNSLDALGYLFGWRFNAYKAHTCSSFVVKSLCEGEVIVNSNTSRNILIKEIDKLLNKHIYYSGSLSDYAPAKGSIFDTKNFYERTSLKKETKRTFYHFYNLFKRNRKWHRLYLK